MAEENQILLVDYSSVVIKASFPLEDSLKCIIPSTSGRSKNLSIISGVECQDE